MPSKVYYIETKTSDTVDAVAEKFRLLIDKSGILKFIKKDDFTGIKMHFGEEGNTGHVRYEWVKELSGRLSTITKNAFVVDSNVLYKNSKRANSIDHIKTASDHGFDLARIGVPLIIAGGIFGRNYADVEIKKRHFAKVKIASDIAECDSLVALTHFTGHMMTCVGGAIKNLGMGCASRRGKYEQHSGVVPEVNIKFCIGCGLCVKECPASCIKLVGGHARIAKESCIGCGECVVTCRTKAIDIKWSEKLDNLQEKMVEYAYGAVSVLKGRIGYISFLIKVTKDCDCLAKDEPRIVEDAGILASLDPVSIDKAAIDILTARGKTDVFKKSNPGTSWLRQLEYAQELGMGSLDYKLENVGND